MVIFLIYLLLINLAGFIMMGLDKHKARNHQWRIPEKALFLVSIAGGSLGSWLGMYVFRHKTKHKAFVIGIPLIFLVQAAVIVILFINKVL